MPVTTHAFRPACQPRSRVREQCRPPASPFRDWLRLRPNEPANVGPARQTTPSQHRAPKHHGEPSQIPPELQGLINFNPNGIPSQPTKPEPPEARGPWFWQLQMSHIEWVVATQLARKFPEAYAWIRQKALERAGYPAEPLEPADNNEGTGI